MLSIMERQAHRGYSGNNETPNHMHKPTINSGLGIARPRQARGIALSQLLLVLEECDRAIRRARSRITKDAKRLSNSLWSMVA